MYFLIKLVNFSYQHLYNLGNIYTLLVIYISINFTESNKLALLTQKSQVKAITKFSSLKSCIFLLPILEIKFASSSQLFPKINVFIIIQETMSDIDFIVPQTKKIERPVKQIKQPKAEDKKKQSIKSFQIEKSFISQTVSQIHQKLRPQVEELKKFIKLKNQRQKKEKQLLTQSLIIKSEKKDNDKQKTELNNLTQKYKVDESGNLRDEKGNLVFVKNQTTDLKINQKKQQERQTKQLSKKQKIKFHQRLSRSFLDRNLVVSGSKKRIRRSMVGLQFLEQGSYQPYSSLKPKVQQDSNLDQLAKNQGVNQKFVKKRFQTKLQFSREVPKHQWWDEQIIDQEIYNRQASDPNKSDQKLNYQLILDIQKLKNEVIFQKVGQQQKRQQKFNIPLYLTKDERKKLKRKRKKQKLIEKNDMVRLGLIQPEKPKLKISNMAIVMKDQFIIDPSRVEAQAKKQQQQRLNKHLQTNAQRKLTKSQKKQKVIRKLKKDSAKECRRIVFKVNQLNETSHIFKVNMNAKQLALNGFILKPAQYHNQPVIIMVQGGEKAIRFYKNLMMNRIRWSQTEGNECKIIWEGQVQNSKLGKWKTIEVGDQSQTMRALAERGVENFRQYIS